MCSLLIILRCHVVNLISILCVNAALLELYRDYFVNDDIVCELNEYGYVEIK